jgi:putative FmdB family regulatory protein
MDMALLDFQCNKCGKKFEELVFGGNWDKVKCPECGSNDLKRIYEGKCYFGMSGSPSGSGGCSGSSCCSCSGCGH